MDPPQSPRLLTIMGSGETTPTMAKVHRGLLARLATLGDQTAGAAVGAVLDTPCGFQSNAGDIVARAQAYFAESVGAAFGVASLRSREVDARTLATFVATVREARYLFSGPGSPSYALRQWRNGPLPGLLVEKLTRGGAVTFASAAALTLGVATVPVYEIYKAGEPPAWLEGLDVLAEVSGLRAAVIPHYNNAEGGNHDTRYCYLGEERLTRMEAMLPEGAFVLGVDEHTGAILDLGAGTATVVGLGGVTVRAAGRSERLESGAVVPIAEVSSMAEGLAHRSTPAGGPRPTPPAPATVAQGPDAQPPGETGAAEPHGASPLLKAQLRLQADFDAAVASCALDDAVGSILDLDTELVAWSRDTQETDQADRAREALHGMIARLGRLAATGARDPASLVGPFVEALLAERARARADRRFADADALRDHLASLGVEVRDTPEGTEWLIPDPGSHTGPGAAAPAAPVARVFPSGAHKNSHD